MFVVSTDEEERKYINVFSDQIWPMRQLVTTKWDLYPIIENKSKKNIDRRVLERERDCLVIQSPLFS